MDFGIGTGLKRGEEEGREEMAKGKSSPQDTPSYTTAITTHHHREDTLFTLPRELRYQIYAYLLPSGDLHILRTCRRLSQDVLDILYRKAIFRMYVNSSDHVRNIRPSKNVVDRIQNIELRWDLCDLDCPRNAHEIIEMFQECHGTRRTCHIIVKLGDWGVALMNATDVHAFRCLRVFQNVVVQAKIKDSDSAYRMSSERQVHLQTRIFYMFKILSGGIGQVLGSADHDRDGDSRYLVFHPSRVLEKRFDKLPCSDTAYSW